AFGCCDYIACGFHGQGNNRTSGIESKFVPSKRQRRERGRFSRREENREMVFHRGNGCGSLGGCVCDCGAGRFDYRWTRRNDRWKQSLAGPVCEAAAGERGNAKNRSCESRNRREPVADWWGCDERSRARLYRQGRPNGGAVGGGV